MKILGIDPSTVATGWGFFTYEDGRYLFPESGVIRGPANSTRQERLVLMFDGMVELVRDKGPDIVCVEAPIVWRNTETTLAMGMVAGAIIVAVRKAGIDVQFYSVTEIRRRVTDYGKSTKAQVAKQIATLMGDPDQVIRHDEADALAVAVCHAYRIEDLAVRA